MRLGDLDALKETIKVQQVIDRVIDTNTATISYHNLYNIIDNTPTASCSDSCDIKTQLLGAELHGIKTGYEEAQKKLIRPQGEWIPISERLPDENGECLVSLDFGDVNIDAFVDGIFVCYLGNVIAWQLLPEPYKGGEENE